MYGTHVSINSTIKLLGKAVVFVFLLCIHIQYSFIVFGTNNINQLYYYYTEFRISHYQRNIAKRIYFLMNATHVACLYILFHLFLSCCLAWPVEIVELCAVALVTTIFFVRWQRRRRPGKDVQIKQCLMVGCEQMCAVADGKAISRALLNITCITYSESTLPSQNIKQTKCTHFKMSNECLTVLLASRYYEYENKYRSA